jgi:hypothetical protein
MSSTELKMQPTIHLEDKSGCLPHPYPAWIGGIENATHNTFGTQKPHTEYGRGKYPDLPSKCIVGCILKSVGLIITRESPCIKSVVHNKRGTFWKLQKSNY